MSIRSCLLAACLTLHAASFAVAGGTTPEGLRIYGPGGPYRAMQECADRFREIHGIEISVTKGKPFDLDEKVRQDGDIYYGGAECMLEAFDRRNPGILDMTSVVRLHPRRIGILVRKGNPRRIRNLEDLQRADIMVLDVKLENMRHLHDPLASRNKRLEGFVFTGEQGAEAWVSNADLDAWVTYRSWHVRLEADSDFIGIDGEAGLRFTPVALTRRSARRPEAVRFIEFLQSEEARLIFEQHGWY